MTRDEFNNQSFGACDKFKYAEFADSYLKKLRESILNER